MITYPHGWARRLFRSSGALAQTLHRVLTQNSFKPNGAFESHHLTCLRKRTFVWLEDLNHRRSFIAKERCAFIQIALAHTLSFLANAQGDSQTSDLSKLSLFLPDAWGFPAVGVQNEQVILFYTLRHSHNQGISTFENLLTGVDSRLKVQGYWPRWVMPFSGHFPKDSKFDWDELPASGLVMNSGSRTLWPILDGSLSEDLDVGANRFHLNLSELSWR